MYNFKSRYRRVAGMRRSFDGLEPQIAPDAYVDETAVVIGDVVVESQASVWPNVTLRGDHGRIVVGERANVQDNAVCHEHAVIESGATVGHGAIVHDATVESGALVGMNATVLDGALIGSGAAVAAGSVVTPGTTVEPSTLVAGVPAEPLGDVGDEGLARTADRYVERARKHRETSVRLE